MSLSKILDWIKKHVWQAALIGFGLFFAPLILVHIAYRIPAVSPWFASTWESGELITYIAGFEAFLGTVALGGATVYLNANANKLSSALVEIEEKRSLYERLPVLQVNAGTAEIKQLSEVLKKERKYNSVLFIEAPPDDLSHDLYAEKDIVFLSFEVTNAGKIPIFESLQSMTAKRIIGNIEKNITLFDLNIKKPN